ncbi:MAG: PilZ domain-containing protein [Myxococcota bacterium]
MKDSEAIRDEAGLPAIGVESPSTTASWRRIPLPAARDDRQPTSQPQRRADARTDVRLQVTLSSIDASRDRTTGELYFETSSDERTQNLSRRGMCVRCERPPAVGTRVLLQLRVPGEAAVDVIGQARWTRIEFEPGEHGARAVALVGIELLGGAPRALARYDRALGRLETLDDPSRSPVATVGGHR